MKVLYKIFLGIIYSSVFQAFCRVIQHICLYYYLQFDLQFKFNYEKYKTNNFE